MTEQKQIVVNRMPGPVRPGAQTAGLTPAEVLTTLRRHIWLIVSMTILGFVAGGVLWYLLLAFFPKYTATTYLRVLPPVEKDPTEIATPQANPDIQYGYRATIAALISQQSSLQMLIDRPKVQDTRWFGRFAKFGPDGQITNKGECILEAFKDLKKSFRAYAEKDEEFVSLSMTCRSPEEAAKIINEMVEWFVASRGRTTRSEVEARLTSLEDRRRLVEREVREAENALDEVRTRWGFTDLHGGGRRYFQHTSTLKTQALELQYEDLALQMAQIRGAVAEFNDLATGPIGVQIASQIENDPVMLSLAQQLALQQSALSGRLARFGENHRVVLQSREMIKRIGEERQTRKVEIGEMVRRAQVLNAESQLVVLGERLEVLQERLNQAKAEQKDLDAAQVQFDQRMVVREERQEMLDSIKENIEKLKILHDDPLMPKVQSTGDAPEPLEVSSPKWELYFPGGTVMGLLLGVGLAWLIEVLNDLVRTPRDVARYLRVPLLGVIPDVAEDRQLRDIDPRHVVRQAPYSVISEAYRRLRANLKLSDLPDSFRTVLVSSGQPGEGRTSVAVNLASTLAAENRKVLLIDANFRRPALHSIFPKTDYPGQENSEFGLSTLLSGLCSYEQASRKAVVEGLDIIEAGPLPANPAELLGSHQMQQLIRDRQKTHDHVIIDTPPVLLVSDAKVLGRMVDAALLVFNAATTRRGTALRTISEFRQVDTTLTGCVLFAVKAMKGGYFQEQIKSYQSYQKLQIAHSV
jgi:capsular exopolysaccharide synthesis family protein